MKEQVFWQVYENNLYLLSLGNGFPRNKFFDKYMKTIFICKAWVMDSFVWLVLLFSWRRISHVEKGATELVSHPCSN